MREAMNQIGLPPQYGHRTETKNQMKTASPRKVETMSAIIGSRTKNSPNPAQQARAKITSFQV